MRRAGGDAHRPPPGVAQGGETAGRAGMHRRVAVQHRVGEDLVEEPHEAILGNPQPQVAKVVVHPRRWVRSHAETVFDPRGHAGAEVGEHAVEIQTDQHTAEVTETV